MRKIIFVLTLLALAYVATGCGVIQGLREGCTGNLVCEFFLGRDTTAKDIKQDAEILNLNRLIKDIKDAIAYMNSDLLVTYSELDAMQTKIDEAIAQLATYSTELRVIDIINPCGDGPGYDEVLLRLSDGTLLAYFEENGHRFLTVLSASTFYRTTDTQQCNFKVTSTGGVVW